VSINDTYRSGPDLYFYNRVFHLRGKSNDIVSFLGDDYHMEMLYATLVSWDMNSRGAKMRYFDSFKENILSCRENFEVLERFAQKDEWDVNTLLSILRVTYDKLNLMRTGGRLVSNSKLLHFLFPQMLMPMDRMNTLKYFYGNTGESPDKYFEIIEVCHEIMSMDEDWERYLDDGWNKTIPKLVDNAIILLVGESIKRKTV
jgi:hypothetical protein